MCAKSGCFAYRRRWVVPAFSAILGTKGDARLHVPELLAGYVV